ncbi:MAG TPA: PEP-CTERM sorting domain-containing protein [Caulobacteraceae bacterium]|jgi:hypothetical protein
MIKISAAFPALIAAAASISIVSPAFATDYVETVADSDVSYSTATFWKPGPSGFETPYTAVWEVNGDFALPSLSLDPGDTLTVDVIFDSPSMFPLAPECCIGHDYQIITNLGPHNVPIGRVIRPWGSEELLTNSGNFATGVGSIYFFAQAYTGGVQMEGDYSFYFLQAPEPVSWSLAILGLGFIGTALRFRRRSVAA